MKITSLITSLMVGTALFGSACSDNQSVAGSGTTTPFEAGDSGNPDGVGGEGGLHDIIREGACETVNEIISFTVYYDSANPDINNCFVGQQVCWIDDACNQVLTICIEPARVNERIAESATRTPSPE